MEVDVGTPRRGELLGNLAGQVLERLEVDLNQLRKEAGGVLRWASVGLAFWRISASGPRFLKESIQTLSLHTRWVRIE